MGIESTVQTIDYTNILKEISNKIYNEFDNKKIDSIVEILKKQSNSKDQFIKQCAMNLYTNYLPMRDGSTNKKSDKEIAKQCIKSANVLASYLF